MSGVLRVYGGGTVDFADRTPIAFGDLRTPTSEVTVSDVYRGPAQSWTARPSLWTTLWEWGPSYPVFNYFFIRVLGGEGFLDLYLRKDQPNDGLTDTTPSGTCKEWVQVGLSCFGQFELNTYLCRVNPVGSDAIGETTALTATSASEAIPSMIGDAGTVEGYWNKIGIYNRGTDPVPFEFVVIA